MRRYVLTSIALLPLLISFSRAAQNWSVDPPMPLLGIPSEESGTGAYLGVDVSDVTTERVSALKLKDEKGVEVTMVDQDAPAGKAGIKEHDVILTMNGTALESGAQLRRMIRETPPGRVVTLGLSRDGQPVTVKVQLGDRRKEFAYSPKAKDFHFELPAMPNMPDMEIPEINVVVVRSSARSGLMVENLTPQLGEFFGVKGGKGVLIRSVEKGSRAEKAGFHAGDVIVKVNNQVVQDTSDFSHALRPHSGPISIGVIRDKKEQNLNLTLPQRKDSGELLEEESFDEPLLDADSFARLTEVQDEIAQLRPAYELAWEDAEKASKDAQKSLCSQSKQMREQAQKLKRDLKPQQEKMKKEQEKLRNEMLKLQMEMQHYWLNI
jgi:membrane-associated protease RseP (regulator of RpoE activity)